MTKFKVGDKVRVLDAEVIKQAVEKGFETGGIYSVSSIDSYGDPRLGVGDDELTLFESELRYIEKIADKPTKNQRISTLESEVSALKAELAYVNQTVEALKQAQVRTDVVKIADQLAEMIVGETINPVPTPNELRKAVIAEARAFVEDAKTQVSGIVAKGMPGAGTRMSLPDVYSTVYKGKKAACKAEFFVNIEKRTVTVLLKGVVSDKLYAKGIAKCAPGDVFNADIGKAIALGRALGLDVSKFEQAVQPTEVVVGMKNIAYAWEGDDTPDEFTVERISEGHGALRLHPDKQRDGYWPYEPHKGDRILDDTEAQYD